MIMITTVKNILFRKYKNIDEDNNKKTEYCQVAYGFIRNRPKVVFTQTIVIVFCIIILILVIISIMAKVL